LIIIEETIQEAEAAAKPAAAAGPAWETQKIKPVLKTPLVAIPPRR
jgi:hypothetical protein